MMGDFQMSLFRVVPELRSRGIVIETAAWYPWKEAIRGTPGFDSLGIFAINCPGEFLRRHDREHVHDRDSQGICCAVPSRHSEHFDRYEEKVAPGKLWQCFLPRNQKLSVKLHAFLGECEQSAELLDARLDERAGYDHLERTAVAENMHLFKEKRMDVHQFRYKEDEHHADAHFPLCTFLNHEGRRSPAAHERRAQKRAAKREKG